MLLAFLSKIFHNEAYIFVRFTGSSLVESRSCEDHQFESGVCQSNIRQMESHLVLSKTTSFITTATIASTTASVITHQCAEVEVRCDTKFEVDGSRRLEMDGSRRLEMEMEEEAAESDNRGMTLLHLEEDSR